MGSIAGLSAAVRSKLGMEVPYAPRVVAGAWVVAGWAALAYGIYLTVVALRLPPGSELTGHWVAQPAFKASMAVLLAVAALAHPLVRERRWLVPALVFSACGDWFLAIPWWSPSFVFGLGSFLLAHLCFLGALVPLAAPSRPRIAAAVLMCVASVSLLVWFWPHLGEQKLTLPVTVYIAVLCAMVCAALLAELPTIWTAVGAVCFAVSDSMIAISRFVLGNEALAVPIWWSYAAALVLITAGFFFGREVPTSAPEPVV
ncbi:putative membrane protein [Mycobacterium kubicae]|uniref:Membrane protein n=2 Tax=Mycobacterium kubicae TaxID=120959 RepID=A0ABQ1BLF8_9MYCO|nr:putative membrane protein [Mycobacterium kubicae]